VPKEDVRLDQQVEELERLLKDGTLAPTVAGAVLEKVRTERAALDRADAKAEGRGLDKVVRLLPRVADAYRRQVRSLMDGTADPRTIHATRAALRDLFGGPVRLIPAESREHLLAEVGLSRTALLQAAGQRVSSGSGGSLWRLLARDRATTGD
jgi:hypothetical protein